MKTIIPLKIRLERRLTVRLLEFFRDMLLAHARADGHVPMTVWTRILADIFARHYASVTRSVHVGRVIDTDESLSDIVGPIHAEELLFRARDQAERIMRRVEQEIAVGRFQAKAFDLQLKKKPFFVELTASLKQLWRNLKARVPTIANMNTQRVAEEANVPLFDPVPAGSPEEEQIVKMWVTKEDRLVRGNPQGKYPNADFSHFHAAGQIVPINQPFIVGGEQLDIPGDVSLGASLKNVINCRCSAAFGVMRDGKFVWLGVATRRGEARSTNPKYQDPRPTSHFTFAGANPRRAKIILGNGERANVTAGTGGITIRVNRKPIASAPVTEDGFGNLRLGRVTVDPRYQNQGIETMLSRSVEATNELRALQRQ